MIYKISYIAHVRAWDPKREEWREIHASRDTMRWAELAAFSKVIDLGFTRSKIAAKRIRINGVESKLPNNYE